MAWSGDSDGQGFCHQKRKPTQRQIRSWERTCRRLTKTVCSRRNFVFSGKDLFGQVKVN